MLKGKPDIWARVVLVIDLPLHYAMVTAMQVRDRVIYYMSTPVTVNVRVSRNETLPFPILSICNKNMFNMTAMWILKTEKANLITRTNGTVLSQKEIDNWDGLWILSPNYIATRCIVLIELHVNI